MYVALYCLFFIFADGCGKDLNSDLFSLSVPSNISPENKWASGYKGKIAFAFLPKKTKVKSFNWTVNQNGKKHNFYFLRKQNSRTNSVREKQSSGLFEVYNRLDYPRDFDIYSHFNIIGKTNASTNFDLEFSLNYFSTTKKCSINNITFSSKKPFEFNCFET